MTEQPTRPPSPTPSIDSLSTNVTAATTNTIIIPATKADGTPVKIWMCAESKEKRKQSQRNYRKRKADELKAKMERLEELEKFADAIDKHRITLIYPDGLVEQETYEFDSKVSEFVSMLLESLRKNNIITQFKID